MCFYNATEHESYTVAKTLSDYYEDGAGVKVRLVCMQDLIFDDGGREDMELDMQLAALSTATCPRRETSHAVRPAVVLGYACCAADVQNVRSKAAPSYTRSVRRNRRFACRPLLVTACTPVPDTVCHACTSACAPACAWRHCSRHRRRKLLVQLVGASTAYLMFGRLSLLGYDTTSTQVRTLGSAERASAGCFVVRHLSLLGHCTTSTQVRNRGLVERVPPSARTLQASSEKGGGSNNLNMPTSGDNKPVNLDVVIATPRSEDYTGEEPRLHTGHCPEP